MIVYVKELENVLQIENIKNFMRNTIELKKYDSKVALGIKDILLVSQQDEIEAMKELQEQIVVYEDIFNRIIQSVFKEYQYNGDYYYYKNAIKKAKEHTTDTLITGSSYGLLGINETMLESAVNLSLTSQDLYYSTQTIYDVCAVNSHVKNIILCCSYYYLYSDLSKSQNPDSQARLAKIYNPIFHDAHNAVVVPPNTNTLVGSCIFDVEQIMEIYSEGEYRKCYFNSSRPRRNFALRLWEHKAKDWIQLTDAERAFAAKERTRLHNKNQRYQKTYAENVELIEELSRFCEKKHINLIVVIAPASRVYRDGMWQGFREVFYETMSSIEGTIHLIDLYEDPRYISEDFIDTDHLSDSGAIKMTEDIISVLNDIKAV